MTNFHLHIMMNRFIVLNDHALSDCYCTRKYSCGDDYNRPRCQLSIQCTHLLLVNLWNLWVGIRILFLSLT